MVLSHTHRCPVDLSPRQSLIMAYHHHLYTRNAPRWTLACPLLVCLRLACRPLAYLPLAYPLPLYPPLASPLLEYRPQVCPLHHFMSLVLPRHGSMVPWTRTSDQWTLTTLLHRLKISPSQK